ncbi:MAG: hypothetical protein ACLUPV_04720 [Bilophila wadsworthia]|uniref:hypothetical protein n=1 Tax=Bilophila wadsworthia TaxID=35833 RepID=UPI00321FC4A8
MSKPERISLYKEEPLTLFSFDQNSARTILRLSAVQTVFKRTVNRHDYRGQSLSRCVHFKLCGLDLSNSFSAMSRVLALVKVFEHRQFGSEDNEMVLSFPTSNDSELRFYCRVVRYKSAYEGMEIGWLTERDGEEIRKSHKMPIGYVHDFRNALHKAMGWISPGTEVEYVELPDIKYEPPPYSGKKSYGYER